MKMLVDRELIPLVDPTNQNRIVFDFDAPADWNSKDSPVQPASIDLHIGEIYYPGVAIGDPGSQSNPKHEGELNPGETAIVTTHEQIKLPANIAAIGFPPLTVSGGGILMTNPGHVDPGFSGKLRFTLINMGKQRFHLKSRGLIVTLLLFELEQTGADHPYDQRVQVPILGPSNDDIDRLSTDFVDFKSQAKAIAQDESATALKEAQKALSEARNLDSQARSRELTMTIIGTIVAGAITILTIAAGVWQTTNYNSLSAKTELLSGQIESLKKSTDSDKRIKDLESRPDLLPRVEALENANNSLTKELRQSLDVLDKAIQAIKVDSRR